jgi:hypothetical protein
MGEGERKKNKMGREGEGEGRDVCFFQFFSAQIKRRASICTCV